MSDERRELNSVDRNLQDIDVYYDNPETDVSRDDYREETAAEIAAPMNVSRDFEDDAAEDATTSGRVLGYSALALSILSLFILPVIMGAAGIVLGFVARRRGAEMLGAWAIGIGAVSIIVGLFVLPFF
ncbi:MULTISPECIES: DUF4190 domain-containing protein [Bacillaceae]|jgi:hypothetical protein|uniref:DUF4190 domain-containing protein n=1 Tax=Rossellomorea vietnamensis TaxID=218284 RepID=A0A0P6VZG5_9BACI|nr:MULTISPECIES: DUF4190 domain-containing protein [Bacillaceae]OXS62966.1 hypothetical protein B1B00_06360 [Bacillus sp. DSM 27956]PRX77805.1 hypothetical protein B0G93_104119 [Bacillus sp. V-88]KPL58583.1 hypothetical protein AM506_15800 [Rossellomorea vietnamensis]MCA0147588.1 DUF4190 domain-containing protein [Rossellomorea vietnamensis]PFG05687.1 hypothetical protein ATG71_2525 [Bacillus sp. es.034]